MPSLALLFLFSSSLFPLHVSSSSLCSTCHCSRNVAYCDKSLPLTDLFGTPPIRALKISGNQIRSLPWKSFASPVKRPPLLELDLRESVLRCSCENQWLLRVNETYWDSYLWPWDPEEFNASLYGIGTCPNNPPPPTTLRAYLRLPRSILLPHPLRCVHPSGNALQPPDFQNFLSQSCADYVLSSRIELNSTEKTATCDVERRGPGGGDNEEACLEGTFVPIHPDTSQPPDNTTRHGKVEKKCAKSIKERVSLGSFHHSGWLRCQLTNPHLLPRLKLLPIFVPGPPLMDMKTEPKEKGLSGGIYEISIDAYPLPMEFRWFFLPQTDPSQGSEIWEIRPSLEFPAFAVNYCHLGGATYILRVSFVELHCVAGQYWVEACNLIGCSSLSFFVPQLGPFGSSCAKVNSTFLVLNLTVTSQLNFSLPSYPTQPPPQTSLSWGLFASLLSAQLGAAGLLTVGLCLCRRRRRGRKEGGTEMGDSQDLCGLREWKAGGGDDCPLLGNRNYIPWLHTIAQDFGVGMIPPEEVVVEGRVGEGAFGEVFRVSRLLPSPDQEHTHGPDYIRPFFPENFSGRMAMKQLKFVSPEKLEDLKREAKVMMNLRHPNIVAFYGVTMRGEGFALLFEYMERGDLANFLREHNPRLVNLEAEGKRRVVEMDLLHYAHQASAGLEYLARHRLVHRDLAARNCLVSADGTVKLSDFGMSRDICVTNYYKMGGHAVVPLRWLPPESIIYRKFTAESDLWSFGVLLWEIFSYGEIPWCQYNNDEVLEIVKEGRILPQPEDCPPELYETVILQCWKLKPLERPDAGGVKGVLESLVEAGMGYCSLGPETVTDLSVHSAELHPPPPSSSLSPLHPDWQIQV